jgi:hypothetical protein
MIKVLPRILIVGVLLCIFPIYNLVATARDTLTGSESPSASLSSSVGTLEAAQMLESGPANLQAIEVALRWNTFLGGGIENYGHALATDNAGNVYIVGISNSTWGSPIRAYSGFYFDPFVAKLSPSGALLWNTFLGGIGDDMAHSIAVDSVGNVYIAGWSTDSWGSPVRAFLGGSYDVWAAKLDTNGGLQWNTFLGGDQSDTTGAVAVDASGNVYVSGNSTATWGTPINPFSSYAGFLARLSGSGALQWNTFFGSSDVDNAWGVAVDGSGNIFVTGTSDTSWGSPVNPLTGNWDGFVAKYDGSGALQWNTFLGSSGNDVTGYGIATDISGNIYVAGMSNATWGSPVNPFASAGDAFAAKLNGSGVLQWNSFLGGADFDMSESIAVDLSGNVCVGGYSYADWGSPAFPFSGFNGPDVFAAKLTSGGALSWNAFLQSTDAAINYWGQGIALDGAGNVLITGTSEETWGSPIRPYTGLTCAFVAKISAYEPQPPIFGGHDYDGNGTSDISIYRPSNGVWYISGQSDTQWGMPGDIPVPGNYDLDAATEIAIFRPNGGLWYISGISTTQWGASGDIPVPHDYNGGGVTDLTVWRPSNGVWYINSVGDFQWGQEGDYLVPSDYNGDGVDEAAVWRPTNGEWFIYGGGYSQWGAQGDIPVPADYDGDGTTDIAVYRPSIGMWYIQYSGGGTAAIPWGTALDIPVPGDYDGNGTTDVAIWRTSNGLWYIYGGATTQYGMMGDVPLVR